MFIEYILIFKYFFVCFLLALILFLISFFFVFQSPNSEKISVYECGFNPFGDSRNKFEIKFYIVAILFMIFDLEIVFLFPWIILINSLFSFYSFMAMCVFLFILLIGFVYEWVKGALDWE